MIVNSILLLQSGSTVQALNYLMIGMMIMVAYFFFIRPQAKKASQERDFIDTLEKGATIVTVGGIHGKINKIDDATVSLLVDNKTYLTIDKTKISMELSKMANGETK